MTNTDTFIAIEARLAKLERRNRLLVVCLTAVIGIAVFTAAKAPLEIVTASEVRANRFVLLDQGGKEVGVWNTPNGKTPTLAMGSSDLKRIELFENEGFGNLFLRGSKEQEILVNTGVSGPSIALYGRNEQRTKRSLARISSDTNGQIELRNYLRTTLRLSSSEHASTPAIEFLWRDLTPARWAFTMYDVTLNGARLNLNNREGKPILVLPEQFSSKAVLSPQKKPFNLFGPRR
jgi:hypothetical protein